MASASFVAGALLAARALPQPHPDWAWLPPREAVVVLRVEETFTSRREGRMAGVATILRADIPHETVRGRRASFNVEVPQGDGLPLPGRGAVIECLAVVTFLTGIAEPEGFQAYLLRRDIHLSLGQGVLLARRAPPPPLERLRQRLYAASQRVLAAGPQDEGAPGRALASMLLGNRSLLSEERATLYRRTGSFHLFAVSGLHVGSVALCLHLLGRLARLPLAVRLLPVLAGTWLYVWLTGSSPSAVRAGIMVTCLALARPLLRQPHPFPALALAAWLVLLRDPLQLFDLGFQLSYAVVAAILLAGLPMAEWVKTRVVGESGGTGRPGTAVGNRRSMMPGTAVGNRRSMVPGTAVGNRRSMVARLLRKGLFGAAGVGCVSLSAGMVSLPLIVQHFGLFTPGGVAVGMLLSPLALWAVTGGTVALLAAPLAGEALAGWVARASWPAIHLMEALLRACLAVPGTVAERQWAWPQGGLWVVLAALAAAWLLQRARQGRELPPATLLVPLALVAAGLALGTIPGT